MTPAPRFHSTENNKAETDVKKTTISTLIAVIPAWLATEAWAVNLGEGLEFNGYLRMGVVSERQTDAGGVNKYALGSGAELFRLGNEGDTYLEASLKKVFQLPGGITWAAAFTGTYWNGLANFRGTGDQGMYVTKEAYVTTSGYAFSPAAIFWAGKRYIEREDVHIVDHFFYSVGGPTIDTGVGATNIPVGEQTRLGISVLRSGQRFSPTDNRRDATRLNVDFYNIPVTRTDRLRVIGEVMHGEFPGGNGGGALTFKYDSPNFPLPSVTNSVWVQGSTGYASLETGFGTLNSPTGTNSVRLIDSVNWQVGRFGGQALAVYQRGLNEHGSGGSTGTSVGGRVSYAVTPYLKLLSEVGLTTLRANGGPLQRLDKYTVAAALSSGPGLLSRPELRIYATRVAWNDAALAAQGAQWGAWSAGRRSTNLYGIQLESWW
ncbi:maltoporin (plasmid) [Ralstonia solanacearum]|nr:maltoporin [Ralstonia solanacearum]BCL99318.1 maltoporin [Ralstonia solanacearum]BCM14794.1 maltoporin [Ralstonia solanacearum]BCN06734.1 maltoporin [Ralstonia solanacearum]BCN12917.1 maltoporin [Ralstonia solanacearum]